MYCPFCSAHETKVTDSRLVSDGSQVRRRRECLACNERWTTYERAELVLPYIIKNDGAREPFLEEKMRSGMLRALEKRPVDAARIDGVVYEIKQRLRSCGDREVSSQQLGEWIMIALRQLDQVAYVRFASVYRSFEDVDQFKQEIAKIQHGQDEAQNLAQANPMEAVES